MNARALSILVADDNEDAATTLASLLTLDGHRVSVAFDGEQALQRAGERRPDIAVLDLVMPRLDGHEVAERLRALATTSRPLLLIALSGSQTEPARRCSAIDAYFSKPVDVLRLERYIADWSLTLPADRCS